jgi:hypothetical protein
MWKDLEAKCYYDPIRLFYGLPYFARLDKCGKNCLPQFLKN